MDIVRIGAGVQAMFDRVVAQMSNWHADSDISRFNRAAPGTAIAMPREFRFVLETALAVARASDGAFDPTMGALVDLWGFGPTPAADPPDIVSIVTAMATSGWRRLSIRDDAALVQPGGLSLDFSSIAKGFGIDLAGDYLKRHGIDHFLLEAGGELRGEGVKPDGTPWWIAVEAPPGIALEEMRIALHGLCAATSGDYRRFRDEDGARLPHSLDPRTGHPIANGVASVTVLHRSCTAADAYSTALTVLGPEDGMALARRIGLAALMVTRSGDGVEEILSPALTAMLG
jgi:thiamine biosynthesis lipoprotein